MGLSCTISEIYADFGRKSQQQNSHPRVFCAPLKGFPLELGTGAVGQITKVMVYRANKEVCHVGAVYPHG